MGRSVGRPSDRARAGSIRHGRTLGAYPQIVAPNDYAQAADAGRKAVARWLAHPETRAILEEYGPALRDFVPLKCAPDQVAATDLGFAAGSWPGTCGWWRPPGVPAWDPDGPPLKWRIYVDRTNPALTSGDWSAGWPEELSAEIRNQRHEYVGWLRERLVVLAKALSDAGAPVDPGSALDICALAQLTLCPPDLTRSPNELVAGLNLFAPFAIGCWATRSLSTITTPAVSTGVGHDRTTEVPAR